MHLSLSSLTDIALSPDRERHGTPTCSVLKSPLRVILPLPPSAVSKQQIPSIPMTTPRNLFFLLLPAFLLFSALRPATAQAPRRNGRGSFALEPVEPGGHRFRRREQERCSFRIRTLDGTCTNHIRKLWASAGTPQYSYLHHHSSSTPSFTHLPSPRYVSNVLCKQSADILNRRGLSEMVVFFGQFLDHTIVATPENKTESMNILIPADDPIFANFSGQLKFHRSSRATVTDRQGKPTGAERPINSLSSTLDLASVYSADVVRGNALRTKIDGKLKTSDGNMLPLNTGSLRNSPTNTDQFYLAGDHRANEHPALTSLHTLFVREHNRLCDELKTKFHFWHDEKLFQSARSINIAQFQKIVFEEFYPALTGRRLRRYYGYKPWVNPTVSDIFAGAAFRIGHTLVGNSISRRGKDMSPLPHFDFMEMFFRSRQVMENGIDDFLRGIIYNRAQEVDPFVNDALRQFLFKNIPQEIGFDLIALNLQRSRDHNLPTYNQARRMFRLSRLHSFSQITRNPNVQSKLANAYGTVDRVELWPGLMAEDHVHGASMGITMLLIWNAEFHRMRDGDRMHYRRWHSYSRELRRYSHRLRAIFSERETLRTIILRNTDITEAEIGPSVWRSRV